MSANTNASPAIRGFNYQETIAVIYLLRYLKELEKINVEGEEDVDLHFSDGTATYIQVKLAENPIDKSRSTALNETLRVLIEDDLQQTNIKELLYVTNSHYPFAQQKDFDFSSAYVKYNYYSFDDKIKKRINNQIKKLKNLRDKGGNLKCPGIHAISQANLNDFFKKFSVVKCAYEGDDSKSREQEMHKSISEFASKIGFKLNEIDQIENGLWHLVSRSAEDRHNEITKESFLAYSFSNIAFNTTDFREFTNEIEIGFESQRYIKNNYDNIESMFLHKFIECKQIGNSYFDFCRDHRTLSPNERLKQFIKERAKEIAIDILGIRSDDTDLDIAKYIIWTVIKQNGLYTDLKKAAYDEN